jgi:8-oxo-dGTP pyrophosphatase MutT (NUDIX family)
MPAPEPFREVAAAILLGTCGRMLFQQRDDIPGLLYRGLVGLFGGHREPGEDAMACVRRELLEETGIDFPASRFEHLLDYRVDYSGGGGVAGSFYIVRQVPIAECVITEGSPLVVDHDDLPSLLHRMTPSTCYVARVYMERMRSGS